MEASVLAVGSRLNRISYGSIGEAQRFIGTAGGLMHTSREQAILLTPLAVVGDDIDSVEQQLDALIHRNSQRRDGR